MNNGAKLTKSGVWTNAPPPVSAARTSGNTVDHYALLQAIRFLPIYYWTSKDKVQKRHMTPGAKDFFEVFQYGEDDQHLAASDVAAVALAAVQALEKENQELKTRLTNQEKQIGELKLKWESLQSMINQMKN